MATNPFRQLDVIRNVSLHGSKVTDCYRLMYHKELWIQAYAKLYPNAVNLTKGKTIEPIDKYSSKAIDEIIQKLKAGLFRFTPIRSVQIPASNCKGRPLRMPCFRDKLVQEVMRMIMDSVYEPVFSINVYGYRQRRSCHTALSQIQNTWQELTWCIVGDIKGLFDDINHQILIKLISKRIDDKRFLLLVHNALTCNVLDNWQYNNMYSNKLQRGSIPPLLANIYLHEFDLFMDDQMRQFDNGKVRIRSKESQAVRSEIDLVRRKINRLDDRYKHKLWPGRKEQIKWLRNLKKKDLTVPLTDPMDKNHRSMKYVRHVNDFVIGIAGKKEQAMKIKDAAENFLGKELAFNLGEVKTHMTHLKNPVPFLGYEFRKRQEVKLKQVKDKNHGQPLKKRILMSVIKLEIPSKKIKDFALKNNYGNLDDFKVTHRTKLINNLETDILMTYNTELQDIASYYKLANNYHHLGKLFCLAENSFIKTLANKRKSTAAKTATSMRKHKQGVLCLLSCDKLGNEVLYQFVKLKDLPKSKCLIKADPADQIFF